IVSDGHQMIQSAVELKPDVVIVDVGMPKLNGLDATEQIKQLLPHIKVIFLTMHNDVEAVAEAFRRGASGFLVKTCAVSEMITCIREILRGGSYLSSSLSKDEVNYLRSASDRMIPEEQKLTDRERTVLKLLAEGNAMAQVGSALGITIRTV